MAHDSTRDFISLRESVEDTTRNSIDPRERYVVSKLNRYELEDRYLRLLDEVNTLKLLSNDQEDKLKKLATKLMRATASLRPCSVALDVLEDKNKISALEIENSKLKQRLSVLRNQLLSHTAISSKPSSSTRIRTPQIRPSSGQMTRSETSAMKQSSYHSMLVTNDSEGKHFLQELEEERNEMRERIEQLEKDLCHCTADKQREMAAENVEHIKVWRQMQQLNEKVSDATDTNEALNAQIIELKSSLEEATKHNHEITQALAAEKKRIADIDEQLMRAKDSQISLREKDEQIKDLMNELKILQDLNDELIALSKKYGQIEMENAVLKRKVSEQLQDQQTLRSAVSAEQASITALQSANEQLVGKLSSFQADIDNLSVQLSVAQTQKESREIMPISTQTPSEHSTRVLSATYMDSKGQLYTEPQLVEQCRQCCELIGKLQEEKSVEPSEDEKCHKCCQLMEKLYLEKGIDSSEMCRIMYDKAVQTDYVAMADLQMPTPTEPRVTASTQVVVPDQDDKAVGEQEEAPTLSPNEMLELLDKVQISTPLEAASLSRITTSTAIASPEPEIDEVRKDTTATISSSIPEDYESRKDTTSTSAIPEVDVSRKDTTSTIASAIPEVDVSRKDTTSTIASAIPEVDVSRKDTTSTIASAVPEVDVSRKNTTSTITSAKAEDRPSKGTITTITSAGPTVDRIPSAAILSQHSEENLSPEPESDETLSSQSDAALSPKSDGVLSPQSNAETARLYSPPSRSEASTTTSPRQSRPRWNTGGITVVPCDAVERKTTRALSKIMEESKPRSTDGKSDASRKRSSVKSASSSAKRHRRTSDDAASKPPKSSTASSSPRKSSTKSGPKKSTGSEKSKPANGSSASPRRRSSSNTFRSSAPGGCTCNCTESTGIPCTSQTMPVKNAVNDMTTSIQQMITGSCITCMKHCSDSVGGYRTKSCIDCPNAPVQDDQNLQKYVDALEKYKERLVINSTTSSEISGTSITDRMNIERTRGGRSMSQTCTSKSLCIGCPNNGGGNGGFVTDTFPLLITNNQGLLELHIAQLQLSTTSKQALFRDGEDSNVSFCVSWEIWNQERASTPILMGPKLNYNSSFVYRIPDLSTFFAFVLSEYVIFQVTIVRQAREEHVAARAKLCIKDILDYPQNKLHYIAPMNSVAACSLGMNFGQLSLWVRLSCDVQKVDAFKKQHGLQMNNELRESKDIARLDIKQIEAKIDATSPDIFEPTEQLSSNIVSQKLTDTAPFYEPLIQPVPLTSPSLASEATGPLPVLRTPISGLLNVPPVFAKEAHASMIRIHRTSSITDTIDRDDATTDEEEDEIRKEWLAKFKKDETEASARSRGPRGSTASRKDEIQADTPSITEFNALLQSPLEKDTLLIEIVDLSLFQNCSIMCDDDVVMLYVEYSFLGYRGESMETQSVEKSKSSNQKLTYNFRKKFRVDEKTHGMQRNTLKAMLDESINPNIRFIVISEPVPEETESKECEEVGYASLNIREFGLGDGQKILSLQVTNQDQSEQIGVLKIFVLGFDVIQQCIEENDEDL